MDEERFANRDELSTGRGSNGGARNTQGGRKEKNSEGQGKYRIELSLIFTVAVGILECRRDVARSRGCGSVLR